MRDSAFAQVLHELLHMLNCNAASCGIGSLPSQLNDHLFFLGANT
jgi:hypothetical protein